MSAYPPKKNYQHRLLVLAVVIAVHGLFIYWATQHITMPVVESNTMPVMQAVVVMPVALPVKPDQPEIQPVTPQPIIQHKTQPIVEKQVLLPPSEKAITLEKMPVIEKHPVVAEKSETVVEKPAPTTPVSEAPVVTKVDATPEPEIILPRSDASGLDNPKPSYPVMSRRLAEQGKVLLDVLILANGKVGDIKIKQSSGFKRLDAAALKTVKQWQFQPAKRGNQAIDYWYVQPISFSLNS